MGFLFSHLQNIHWNCKVKTKQHTSVGEERDLKQPDVPVWLQELIPVKNTLPHISFGWEWSEACEGFRQRAGGRAGSHQFFWCRLMHDSSPVLNIKFSFSSAFIPNHEKGFLEPKYTDNSPRAQQKFQIKMPPVFCDLPTVTKTKPDSWNRESSVRFKIKNKRQRNKEETAHGVSPNF